MFCLKLYKKSSLSKGIPTVRSQFDEAESSQITCELKSYILIYLTKWTKLKATSLSHMVHHHWELNLWNNLEITSHLTLSNQMYHI